jgi:hypothetical protein
VLLRAELHTQVILEQAATKSKFNIHSTYFSQSLAIFIFLYSYTHRWCIINSSYVSLYGVSQKHLKVLEMKWHFKARWKNFINLGRYVLCHWEFMLIVTVWIWHFVGDHHAFQYTPAVTMERMSPGLPARLILHYQTTSFGAVRKARYKKHILPILMT